MIPVVLEERCRQNKSFKGLFGIGTGGSGQMRMHSDFTDRNKFEEGIEELAQKIFRVATQ